MDLTPDQLQQLTDLGLNLAPPETPSNPSLNVPNANQNDTIHIKDTQSIPPSSGEILNQTVSSTQPDRLLTPSTSLQPSKKSYIPLLSISGLTLLSFGGLVLLKGKGPADSNPPPSPSTKAPQASNLPTPTQVPKSIQHYLLSSQQFFSQALQSQQAAPSIAPASASQQTTIDLLNKSIMAASSAIQEFPADYRGYKQRGRIYQALLDSQPALLPQAIGDLAMAFKLNSSDATVTRDLAALYARKGDARTAIAYLSETISIDPTQAQNFYDLARLEQQIGFIPQAIQTYDRLLTLVTDPAQKQQIEKDKLALQNLTKQLNPVDEDKQTQNVTVLPNPAAPSPILNAPTLQAMADSPSLIIAAPEDAKKIEVKGETDSNSFSGNSTLLANQKSISITNSHVTSSSQVYLTVTKGGKNLTLQVLSKSAGSFTVGLDEPTFEDIEFKWWIIN